MTSVEKTSYFEVVPPGYTIAYKNIDNLSKNKSHILYFDIKSENRMIKKCSKYLKSGFDFMKAVYELFL